MMKLFGIPVKQCFLPAVRLGDIYEFETKIVNIELPSSTELDNGAFDVNKHYIRISDGNKPCINSEVCIFVIYNRVINLVSDGDRFVLVSLINDNIYEIRNYRPNTHALPSQKSILEAITL